MENTPSGADAIATNHWSLTAQLAEMAALRFTPAGLPVVDCVLMHQSKVLEAGTLREVQIQVKAIAMGTLAEQLGKQPLGMQAQFAGFVGTPKGSRKNTSSGRLVFHIQSFVPQPPALTSKP